MAYLKLGFVLDLPLGAGLLLRVDLVLILLGLLDPCHELVTGLTQSGDIAAMLGGGLPVVAPPSARGSQPGFGLGLSCCELGGFG